MNLIPIALTTASILGALTFALVFSDALKKNPDAVEQPSVRLEKGDEILEQSEFLQLEPIMISLGSTSAGRQLRFEGYLEIAPQKKEETIRQMPRIVDALNTYLRAIKLSDLDEPSSLLKIRLQMLKRVQLIAPEGSVKDLLISKFLVN